MPAQAAMARLKMNRIDFYRLRSNEFFGRCFQIVQDYLGKRNEHSDKWKNLNLAQQALYGWWPFMGNLENGGLTQFFLNCSDTFVPSLVAILKKSSNDKLVKLIQQATKLFHKHHQAFLTMDPWGDSGLFSSMTELSSLDNQAMNLCERAMKPLEKWLRTSISDFALGDDGVEINPKFTGEIVTHHKNKNVHEHAFIRRGQLHGAYRKYSEDGTLVHSIYFDGGNASTDYWPTGQPKLKEFTQGKRKVTEWYYPSGKLQKRFVADKSGYAVEPVRLWHENGQLAEEIHTAKGKKRGSWLKFFEDGSPHLQAEHSKGETLIVHNAWDEQRKQVVKKGAGVFTEPAKMIDVSYDLFFESDYVTTCELKNGIPHKSSTTISYGVLGSRNNYRHGKLHGQSTHYYDNGKVHLEQAFRDGKLIKEVKYDKFADPQPVVFLEVEVDDELYTAWKRELLDAYPQPRNLKEIEKQLEIPQFLHEVHQRNLSKPPDFDDYEDTNRFDDTSAYFAFLDQQGRVTKVEFRGCSAYSVGVADSYVPFLKKLRFSPGRLRGKKVVSKVFVTVHHTFAERR